MSHVIFLFGGVEGIERYPELNAMVGKYVQRYEPENARKGEQWLWATDDQNEAVEFDDVSDAHAFWTQEIGTRPWDGRPDRPLTVFHVEIMPKGKEPVRVMAQKKEEHDTGTRDS